MNLSELEAEVFINTAAESNVIMHFLKRGAIDFFTISESLRATVTKALVSGEKTFLINAGSGNDFLKIVSLKLNGEYLSPVTVGGLNNFQTIPTVYFCDDAGNVTFNAAVASSASVVMEIAITPNGDTVADAALKLNRDAVISACLSKLLLLPKKPYTDANLATFHMNKYMAEAEKQKIKSYTGRTSAPLHTKPQFVNGK
jgi:hypothetical protein